MTTTTLTSSADLLETRPSRAGHGVLAAAVFNLRSALFNPFMLAFSVIMPVLLYLMFGVGKEYTDIQLGRGTMGGQILVQMTFFGAVNALSALGVTVAMERQQGWLRQIAITPLGAGRYALSKVIAGFALAIVIIAMTYLVGFVTGAQLDAPVWLYSAIAILFVALIASSIGLAAAFFLRSDAAYAATSGVVTLSAFISGIFLPLEEMPAIFQSIAQFTPFYGLARLPLVFIGGEELNATVIISAVAYTAVFLALAMWGATIRKDRK
ncbi:hypothetical protein BSZ39_03215 [Bowdeniella nasicola]|uniref:ABC-2 type transporter transmembrane domain-containing protein n=1 Tax=Bowdeniella nasicola TaxID=208480 RepID=A0A1Q5Q4K0_9ACTO|nr:ABC transporter permease [Bowdeniella nasicola]OKL54622.1 hypothetical protein BSZ39_03215 [Bowdeniella nasicola]